MVICPGGGYHRHASHEAEPVASWLNSLGIHAAILRYRARPWRYPAAQADIMRSIRLLRACAEDLQIQENLVGVLGFSAGGHVAASGAVLHEVIPTFIDDDIDTEEARPDLAILCYPVLSCTDHCHDGSWKNLLGEKATWQQRAALTLKNWIDPDTCPCFLWSTSDDPAVPVHNTYEFAGALADAGIQHRVSVHPSGRHGIGLALEEESTVSQWSQEAAAWLHELGWGSPTE